MVVIMLKVWKVCGLLISIHDSARKNEAVP
jgi:hypothetical protein